MMSIVCTFVCLSLCLNASVCVFVKKAVFPVWRWRFLLGCRPTAPQTYCLASVPPQGLCHCSSLLTSLCPFQTASPLQLSAPHPQSYFHTSTPTGRLWPCRCSWSAVPKKEIHAEGTIAKLSSYIYMSFLCSTCIPLLISTGLSLYEFTVDWKSPWVSLNTRSGDDGIPALWLCCEVLYSSCISNKISSVLRHLHYGHDFITNYFYQVWLCKGQR